MYTQNKKVYISTFMLKVMIPNLAERLIQQGVWFFTKNYQLYKYELNK